MGRARTPQDGEIIVDWAPDLRARYERLCEYYAWLPDVCEAYQFRMAYLSLYRPAYVFPGSPKTSSNAPDPWRELVPAEVEAWRARDLGERWATEDGIARCLAWLHHEFGEVAKATP